MTTMILRTGALLAVAALLSVCQTITGLDMVVAIGSDRGVVDPFGLLANMEAGIWVDPDGCHNWIIDDGAEGYMSRRRDPRTGLPVCVPIAEFGQIVGNFCCIAPGVIEVNPGSGV